MNNRHMILTLEVEAADAPRIACRIDELWGRSAAQLERPGCTRAWVEVYYDDPAEASIAETLMASWPDVCATSVRSESPRDWSTFWRHHFRSLDLGKHLRIVPEWVMDEEHEECMRHRVRLDPGLSFGTGDHFTTRFCLEMLDRWVPTEQVKTVLDIGTGSGILVIAARLLGAVNVVGIDLDPMALDQARKNVALNRIHDGITLTEADLHQSLPDGAFDLVCANVYTSVLLEEASSIAERTGDYLVLSGIRDQELEQVAVAFTAKGFSEVFRDGDGEWGGLAFRKSTVACNVK